MCAHQAQPGLVEISHKAKEGAIALDIASIRDVSSDDIKVRLSQKLPHGFETGAKASGVRL
jgi:hypothetical protein